MSKKEIKLELVKEGNFLGTECNFYKDDKNNIYMTREQIGQALEYSNPRDGVFRIHKRNKDRLDNLSTVVNLTTVEGKREVSRDRVLYIEKGIYDICRFSRQPTADKFYDWVYNQISLIRKTGAVIDDKGLFIKTYCVGMDEAQKIMVKGFMTKVEQQQEQIDEMEPHVEDWRTYMDSNGNVTISNVAKSLNVPKVGRNKLFKILRKKKVLQNNNEPFQTYVNRDYFKVVNETKNNNKHSQTVVTGKGMGWIRKKMIEWGYM